ncbi:MAG: hypothetical protein H6706_18115 [Myxococcales bacterium]|nr:hypothetical protein [Myxococcales bacterium]
MDGQPLSRAPLSARPLGPARRSPRIVAPPRPRPPTHPGWVVAGALAVHLALVVAPWVLTFGPDGVKWGALSLLAPLLLVYGLVRQSPWALLVGVPLGWALPAHGLPDGAFSGSVGLVALLAVAAYIPTALAWLRPRDAALAEVPWTALDDEPARAPLRPLPWVAGAVVTLPAVGVALWPEVGRQVAVGHAGVVGQSHVALTLMVLLVGLALATDLARGRPAMVGNRRRVPVLAIISALTILGGVLLGR